MRESVCRECCVCVAAQCNPFYSLQHKDLMDCAFIARNPSSTNTAQDACHLPLNRAPGDMVQSCSVPVALIRGASFQLARKTRASWKLAPRQSATQLMP